MSGAGDNPRKSPPVSDPAPDVVRMQLLIGSGSDYDTLIRAATSAPRDTNLLVLFGSDAGFPFRPRPSTILVDGMPPGVIACVPALEEFGIASRLASTAGLPGCYDGSVTELARSWLQSLQPTLLETMEIVVHETSATAADVENLGRELGVTVLKTPAPPPEHTQN